MRKQSVHSPSDLFKNLRSEVEWNGSDADGERDDVDDDADDGDDRHDIRHRLIALNVVTVSTHVWEKSESACL